MSITKYTNFQNINSNTENTGQFLDDKDLFIVSQNNAEPIQFGNTPYDVMEVSVYDINNNLINSNSTMIVKANFNTNDNLENINSNNMTVKYNMTVKSNFKTPVVITDIYINNDAVALK